LRPLAPRTTSGLVPENPDPSTNEEHKVKRASMACAECKRRRTKCSYDTTGSPCTECTLQGCQCFVDESADKRRKVAAKRSEEENKRLMERVKHLEGSRDYERQFKGLLIRAFREGDNDSAAAIIHSIRAQLPEKHLLEVLNQVL
ncbi:Zn(II)2Cys6 transcription factor domain-containing protein, partial [Aspergillus glaucus CBS 516.65]